jgi:hypothetical protein
MATCPSFISLEAERERERERERESVGGGHAFGNRKLFSCPLLTCCKEFRVVFVLLILVAGRSKTWVSGRLPAEVVGLNSAEVMDA